MNPFWPEKPLGYIELISAAEGFVFDGYPTTMLHPSVRRNDCFPDNTIMPRRDLDRLAAHAAVGTAIKDSLDGILRDWAAADSFCAVVPISAPGAYIDLLVSGETFNQQKAKTMQELGHEGPSTLSPGVIASVIYEGYKDCIPGKDGIGILRSILRGLEPISHN